MFQHTAARRRLDLTTSLIFWTREFQHTAARRRLDARKVERIKLLLVSTHSRPKAAGRKNNGKKRPLQFQHTAARRRLDSA